MWVARGITPEESLAAGSTSLLIWRSLNRHHTGRRFSTLMHEWGLSQSPSCPCGKKQYMAHTLCCPLAPNCTEEDLTLSSPEGLACELCRDTKKKKTVGKSKSSQFYFNFNLILSVLNNAFVWSRTLYSNKYYSNYYSNYLPKVLVQNRSCLNMSAPCK